MQAITFTTHPQTMYNFTVATAHTYFVGDKQWLVHNCDDVLDRAGADSLSQGFRGLSGDAKNARWVPSRQGVQGPSLRDHYENHVDDLINNGTPAKSAREYDLSARLTIQNGRKFGFRNNGQSRIGYWDPETNLFTSTGQTRKDIAIMTHYPMSQAQITSLPGFSGFR